MPTEAALLLEAEAHSKAADILDTARDILEHEGLPQDDPHLDLVLHALVRGVEIGLLDSELSQEIIRFSLAHERLYPPSVPRNPPVHTVL